MDETQVEQNSEQGFKLKSYLSPKEHPKEFLVSIAVFAAIMILGGYIAVQNSPQQKEQKETKQSTAFSPLADKTVVFGYWTDNKSIINAEDLSSGKLYNLGILPSNIKKVTVISSGTLLFINKTDDNDHGQEIAEYNIESKNITSLVLSEKDYGIDDYVISPNKRYLALWEIRNPQNSEGLIGGGSRVYTVDLQNPGKKYLIYDEIFYAGGVVNYPLAIADDGKVILDKFQANNVAGWANGMAVSAFDRSQKQEIASMAAGTYATQPVLSPDGKFLAFSGYDGLQGNGTLTESNIVNFKKALLNPNTVEIFDIGNNKRIKVDNLSNSDRYVSVSWDGNKVLFSTVSKDVTKNGIYQYDPANLTYKKIKDNSGKETVLSSLGNNRLLIGSPENSQSTLGNLGGKYSSPVGSVSVFDYAQNKAIPVNLGSSMAQFIGILPSNYFIGARLLADAGSSDSQNKQLQIDTFETKPTLAPKREKQQTKPIPTPGYKQEGEPPTGTCHDLAQAQCINSVGPNTATNNQRYWACYNETFNSLMASGSCYDSPLYLYGEKGEKVKIKINTKISSPLPYSQGVYDVILGKNGEFSVEGQNYSKISFNYAPATPIPTLDYGRVVNSQDVKSTVEEYGGRFGLNKTEIDDLNSSLGNFSSPFVLVSFFDEEASKEILPIIFNPVPDTYLNIVFYFKPLSIPISIKEPVFVVFPERKSFTAVEVSYFIDR